MKGRDVSLFPANINLKRITRLINFDCSNDPSRFNQPAINLTRDVSHCISRTELSARSFDRRNVTNVEHRCRECVVDRVRV